MRDRLRFVLSGIFYPIGFIAMPSITSCAPRSITDPPYGSLPTPPRGRATERKRSKNFVNRNRRVHATLLTMQKKPKKLAKKARR